MNFLSDLIGGITRNVNLFQNHEDFESIAGYDDVKNIIRRTEESFNLLLWGEPASSKTLFLLEIAKQKGAVFSIVPIRQAGF